MGCLTLTDRVLEENPSDVYALYYQALAYTQLGKSDKAITSYEKVIDFTQNNPNALVKYHKLLPTRYTDKRNIQDDEFLDELIYGKKNPTIKSA